jgi:hypothetical protein
MIFLLDQVSGDLYLSQVDSGELLCRSSKHGLHCGLEGGVSLSNDASTSVDIVYPISQIGLEWQQSQNGPDLSVSYESICIAIVNWIAPFLIGGSSDVVELVVLFPLGTPEAFRLTLLENLASSSIQFDLLLACTPWLLALSGDTEGDTEHDEFSIGIGEWSYSGSCDKVLRGDGSTMRRIASMSWRTVASTSDTNNLLASLQNLIAAVRGANSMTLDLQPSLQLCTDSVRETCIALGLLIPGAGAKVELAMESAFVKLGCGLTNDWSASEVLADLELSNWPSLVQLEWSVDEGMCLTLSFTSKEKSLLLHRQLMRPLLLAVDPQHILNQQEMKPA